MSGYNLIKTNPGQDEFALFHELPKFLYPENSQRFNLGHEPVTKHLEGCYILIRNEKAVGRFALYFNPHLLYHQESTCSIGSYECEQNPESSKLLLEHATNLARKKGVKWLIGPMDSSTWNSYRFSLQNEQVNFFMEPYHHIYYNTQFKNSGFGTIGEYVSNIDTTLDTDKKTLDGLEREYRSLGAVIRNLRMDDFENEMQKLAQCSIDWFKNNFLYTPISVDEFVGKYTPLKPLFNPELVWIIEDKKGDIHAFIFGIKDYWDKLNQTLIIKSVARKPNSPFKKAGTFLGGKINQSAKKMGYPKVIHAMMISDNASLEISKFRTGTTLKSYQLYGKKL